MKQWLEKIMESGDCIIIYLSNGRHVIAQVQEVYGDSILVWDARKTSVAGLIPFKEISEIEFLGDDGHGRTNLLWMW